LEKPIYAKTTNYGHFGKKELPWEKIVKIWKNQHNMV
jgi:S-adenosylmethionine synthetase